MSTAETTPSPVLPPSLQDLVDLFQGPLQTVQFPDIDAPRLLALVAEVGAAQEAVHEAEQLLAEAKREREERLEALLNKAHRALAYARVFAEEDQELSAKLATVNLPKTRKTPLGDTPFHEESAPRRRARQRRPTVEEALSLPAMEPASPAPLPH